MLRNEPEATTGDRAAAENVIKDLRDALAGNEEGPVSAEEFTRFAARLDAITSAIGDALEADGEERVPDMEMPVLWMSAVGHAVAVVLPTLPASAQRAVFDLVEDGMASGGELLRTAVATGLLEALAHDMDRFGMDRDLLERHLGVQSRAYLRAWDAFTLGEPSP